LDWRKATIGIWIIFTAAILFTAIVLRPHYSISAVYARIADLEKDASPSVPSLPFPMRMPLRHKSVGCYAELDTIAGDQFFAFPGFQPDEDSETMQSSAIINAIAASASGFNTFEKIPAKSESFRDNDEIQPNEIRMPPAFTPGEKARVGREYTILVEEQ
jgi:hypothetical protein